MSDQRDEAADQSGMSPSETLKSWSGPVTGGIVGALVWFGVMFALGSVGDVEARQLLESSMPSLRFTASTVATAGATVLALMLTLLSLSNATSDELKSRHYRRIAQIAWMSSVNIVTAIFILILLAMPLAEADKFPTSWFDYLYYAVLGSTSVVGGMFITMVIMLLNAVRGLIHVVSPRLQSELVAGD
jgi:hypothetical protein